MKEIKIVNQIYFRFIDRIDSMLLRFYFFQPDVYIQCICKHNHENVFCGIIKLTLKFIWKSKRPRIAKQCWRTKLASGITMLLC
jgi:hypothetical protein